MAEYLLGIDQGTTLTTAVIMDEKLKIRAKASKAHHQYYPYPGWVEHNPMEIYNNILAVTLEALAQIPNAKLEEVIGMGLDHQGETCVVWDKTTGVPIYNAIVWQDRRTADWAEQLKEKHGKWIRDVTGMMPDAYHSATKIKWILDNVEGAGEKARRGELLAGTLNTWLFWKLTNGKIFATDACSANRFMLMDIRSTEWNKEITDLLEIPIDMLPPICDCNEKFGYTEPAQFLGVKVQIAGSIPDAPAGLIGGGCTKKGILKASYGTGCFMNLLTGEKLVMSDKGIFSSCCWRLNGKKFYNISGAAYIAGAAVEWLRQGLRMIDSPEETEVLSMSVPDTNGVYFVPAFAGLATPFWDQYARGLFIGLTGGVTKEHMVRAVMEGIAYQAAYCIKVMKQEYKNDIHVMRADGGMIGNQFLMQLQSNLIGIPIEIPKEKEAAAYGAACLAAYSMGIIPSIDSVRDKVEIIKTYEPNMSEDERGTRLEDWLRAVERSRDWVK